MARMTGKGLFVLLVVLTASGASLSAAAENAPNIEEACKTFLTNCRHNLTVHLRQLDGTEYRQTIALTYPPVQNKTFVTIFPDETLHLIATVEGDQISDLAPASTVKDATRTIEFKLTQFPDKPGMMLRVINPFGRLLKYRAALQVPTDSELVKTSTCTVMAGKQGFETWPYPIFQITLSNFQLLPATDEMTCE